MASLDQVVNADAEEAFEGEDDEVSLINFRFFQNKVALGPILGLSLRQMDTCMGIFEITCLNHA